MPGVEKKKIVNLVGSFGVILISIKLILVIIKLPYFAWTYYTRGASVINAKLRSTFIRRVYVVLINPK